MKELQVVITRFVEDSFPGWVECHFVDAHGHDHEVIEKVPIVSTAALRPETKYPQEGAIRCEILTTLSVEKSIVRVTTARPDAVETTAGTSEFDVLVFQVREIAVPLN